MNRFRPEQPRNRTRPIALGLLVVVVIGLILLLAGVFGGGVRGMNPKKLRCIVSQKVTPFGDRIVYYDGVTLYCLNANGSELWKYTLGEGADFSVGERILVAWIGEHLHIIDQNGRATFNDRLPDTIQFARAGKQYVAAVTGNAAGPTLLVKDVNGLAVDTENVAYEGKMILDIGFFERGEYLWSTSLDVYGVAPQITMNIYRVGQMTTGLVELGEEITYGIVFAGDKLNVINTRELNRYDYRGIWDPFSKQLVYGWQLIDHVPDQEGTFLFAPVLQTADERAISELRILTGKKKDTRYSLPDTCVGAGLKGKSLFAVSSDSLYQSDLGGQRFSAVKLPLNEAVTGYIGKLTSGQILVNAGQTVYVISLP